MKSPNVIGTEIRYLKEAFSVKEKRKFKSFLSPKLREMFDKIELFEYNYNEIKSYLKNNIEPPSYMIGELVASTEELLDDLTFIVRNRLSKKEQEEFEKRMKDLKKKFEKVKEQVISVSIGKETKLRQISIYIELASSFVLRYLKVLFADFKDSVSLTSDIWLPMEKKFSEMALRRIGIVAEEEEEKKKERGEEL